MSAASKSGSQAAPKGKRAPSKSKAATKTITAVRVLLDGRPATGLYVVFAALAPTTEGTTSGLDKVIQEVSAGKRPKYTLGVVDAGGYVHDVKPEGNPWDHLKANPHSDKLVAGVAYAACLIVHPDPAFGRAMESYLTTGKAPEGIAVPKPAELKTILQNLKSEAGTGKDKGPVINLPTESKAYWPAGGARYGGWNLYWKMPHERLDSVQKALRELVLDLGALRFPVSTNQFHPYAPDKSPAWQVLTAAIHGFQHETATAAAAFKIAGTVGPRDLAKKASAAGRTGAKSSWAFLLGQPVKLVKAEPPKAGTAVPAKPEAAAAGTVALKHWLAPAEIRPGVVDKQTGDAIGDWLEHGLRKAGHILVEIWSTMEPKTTVHGEDAVALWARDELACAVEAWRDLAVGLGCLYGISCHHTFRNLLQGAREGSGAVDTSRHKLGLSVDLSAWNYANPKANWPIRFEVEWEPLKALAPHLAAVQKTLKRAKAKADAAIPKTSNPLERAKLVSTSKAIEADLARLEERIKQSKTNCRPWWRLYVHSILDAEQPAALAAQVKQRFGFAGAGKESAIEASHRKRLAEYAGSSPASPEFLAFWQTARDKLRAVVERLVAMATPTEAGTSPLASTLFRAAIKPFVIQGFEVQGGYEAPATKAGADAVGCKVLAGCSDPYRPAKATDPPEVKSWLNLSRLGYECGMLRIPGQPKGDSFRRPDANLDRGAPMAWDNLKMVSAHLEDSVIADLRKLQGTATRDPGIKERALFLVSKEPGEKKQFRSLTIDEIDIDFLEQWRKELPALPMEKNPPEPPVFRKDAVVSLVLADPAAPDPAVTKFLSSYASKQFRVASVPTWYPQLASKDEVVTGKVLASRIDELAKTPKNPKARKHSESKITADYSIGLVPAFELPQAAEKANAAETPAAAEKKPPAPTIFLELDTAKELLIPTRGRPGKFEWWHFDHEKHIGHSWLDLGAALGYSEAFLMAAKKGKSPFWHGGLGHGDATGKFPRLERNPVANGDTSTTAATKEVKNAKPWDK